jgi:uncharacterized protein YqhQ
MSSNKGQDGAVKAAVEADKLLDKRDKRNQRKEKAVWLIRMIYLMALLFVITVFELDGVFYALTAFFAQLLDGIFDNADTWVATVKGSLRVILIGGFCAATVAARLIARQRA